MKNVIYLHVAQWRMRTSGICQAALENNLNVIPFANVDNQQLFRDLITCYRPAGYIVESGLCGIVRAVDRRRGVPVVACDDPAARNVSKVIHDPRSAGAMAARFLIRLGLENFALVGTPLSIYSWEKPREDSFIRELARLGHKALRYSSNPKRSQTSKWLTDLATWLQSLPKPCGIFAVYDPSAAHVIALARQLKLRVPQDLVVLGVDNDPLICDNLCPTLSSIQPDFSASGEMAVKLLMEKISDPGSAPRTLVYGDERVVTRKSTMLFRLDDGRVRDAQEFIRANCRTHITSADVARTMGCSRRHADQLFARALGSSISETIGNCRLELAQEMLVHPDSQIADVAARCGFSNALALNRAFKRQFGIAPKPWSLRHATEIEPAFTRQS